MSVSAEAILTAAASTTALARGAGAGAGLLSAEAIWNVAAGAAAGIAVLGIAGRACGSGTFTVAGVANWAGASAGLVSDDGTWNAPRRDGVEELAVREEGDLASEVSSSSGCALNSEARKLRGIGARFAPCAP